MKYKNRGLVVLGVNTADDKNIAVKYLAENRVTFPNVLDATMKAWELWNKYETMMGLGGVPLTYIIDPEGKIVDAWYGYEEGRAERLVKKLDLPEEPEEKR